MPSFLFLVRVQKEEPFLRDALSKKKKTVDKNSLVHLLFQKGSTRHIPVYLPKLDHAIIVLESCKSVVFFNLSYSPYKARFSLAYFWHVKSTEGKN